MGEGKGKGEKMDVKVPPTMGKYMCHATYLMRHMIAEVKFSENGVV